MRGIFLLIVVVGWAFLLADMAEGAEPKPVAVSLQELRDDWTDECVKFPNDDLKTCIKNVRTAIDIMFETFREADLHEGLRALAGFVTQRCANDLAKLGPEDNSSTLMLANCTRERWDAMIEHQGGLTEYLIWYNSLDDPEA